MEYMSLIDDGLFCTVIGFILFTGFILGQTLLNVRNWTTEPGKYHDAKKPISERKVRTLQ